MVAAHAGTLGLARYVGWPELFGSVFSTATWRRAAATGLHSPLADAQVAVQSIGALAIVAAIAILALRGLARFETRAFAAGIATAAMFVVACICAARTPEAAALSARRLHVDMERSRDFGPLIDERGLLRDEVNWALANGRDARAAATSRELAAIDVRLSR
jgi:hypothetical protein